MNYPGKSIGNSQNEQLDITALRDFVEYTKDEIDSWKKQFQDIRSHQMVDTDR